ncbi:hypothetical protein QBC47DRAFT_148745 [Echria macrotheca]|uniref:Cellobiose dehydrogenase-like cytochrome domain-containing protein n=1 Tax=Echria macrotheca TaxID=438768 RepID=A0AAJ0BIP8_9PEZI|nr:hypothetical protein QBC47DRAFT_148745 [Echria macrotheca]
MSQATARPQHRTRRTPQRVKNRTGRGLLLGLALASPAVGQTTSAFTDQATGIQFQRFFGARTGFGFGIALPTNPSNSFIGQLSFPLANGAGWGGFSLTGDMEGPLLMAAWPDGQGKVVASFRQAFNEDDNPPEVTGSFAVRPIATGTSVNNTFLTFTFLCEGCLDDTLGLGAARTAGTAEMGWGLASIPVRNPGSSNGVLGFHNSGFGDFRANLAAARNAEFATWAALAGEPLAPSAGARAFTQNAGSGDEGDGSGDSGNSSGDDSDSDNGFVGAGRAAVGGAAATGGNRGAVNRNRVAGNRANRANRRATKGVSAAVIDDAEPKGEGLGRRQFNDTSDDGFTDNSLDSDSDFFGAAGRPAAASSRVAANNRVAANRGNRRPRRRSTGEVSAARSRRSLNRRQGFNTDSDNDSADSLNGFDSGDDTDDGFFGAAGRGGARQGAAAAATGNNRAAANSRGNQGIRQRAVSEKMRARRQAGGRGRFTDSGESGDDSGDETD